MKKILFPLTIRVCLNLNKHTENQRPMQIQQYSAKQLEGMIEQFAFDGFQELNECREQVDDCLAGQKTIKEKKRYLPPNEWQENPPSEYKAFLRRALFPGETKYALDIYDGLFAIIFLSANKCCTAGSFRCLPCSSSSTA